MRRRGVLWIAGGGLLIGALALLGLSVGAVALSPAEVWAALTAPDGTAAAVIVRRLRLPRVLLAILVGAGLAGSGAAYQALFRNPLADPYVIGASSGAALGAALAVLARGAGWPGPWLMPVAAFGGALASVGLVWLLGGSGERSSPVTLLLAGVAVSTILGAAVSLLMILDDQSLRILFGWLLGSLSGSGWSQLAYGTPMIVLGIGWVWLLARSLDALALGDETAQSLGLSLWRSRLAIVAAASLTAAAAVSMTGVIGFVGLIAPHAARLVFGGRHGVLVPASCLAGAVLLLAADMAARTLAAPQEIPVGIVTALLGGPFFLYLLRRTLRPGRPA